MSNKDEMKNLKCGQYVWLDGQVLCLFLGYIENKFVRCVVADLHGNKQQVWVDRLQTKRIRLEA
jgi:hypothetical protein